MKIAAVGLHKFCPVPTRSRDRIHDECERYKVQRLQTSKKAHLQSSTTIQDQKGRKVWMNAFTKKYAMVVDIEEDKYADDGIGLQKEMQ